jgi:hypothetical protein
MADGYDYDIVCSLAKFVGQTVTIFTTSGGLSGCGFTGVLMSVDDCIVRILTKVGAAPGCPVGSDCGYPGGGYGSGAGKCGNYNFLGSITVIPVDRIASFVHNAI